MIAVKENRDGLKLVPVSTDCGCQNTIEGFFCVLLLGWALIFDKTFTAAFVIGILHILEVFLLFLVSDSEFSVLVYFVFLTDLLCVATQASIWYEITPPVLSSIAEKNTEETVRHSHLIETIKLGAVTFFLLLSILRICQLWSNRGWSEPLTVYSQIPTAASAAAPHHHQQQYTLQSTSQSYPIYTKRPM